MVRCNFTISAFAAIVLCCASPADAGFMFNGFSGAPAEGEFIQFKLTNYEVVLNAATVPAFSTAGPPTAAEVVASAQPGGVVDDVGDQLFGILNITSINGVGANAANQYWVPSATQQLSAVFWGYTAKAVSPGATGVTDTFTLGGVRLYFDDTPDFSAGTGPFTAGWAGVDISNGVGNAGDSLFLEAFGVGGTVAGESDVTIKSTFDSLNPSRFTGHGDGFFDIAYTSTLAFATDGLDGDTSAPPYPGNQDLSFKSNFDSRPPGTPSGMTFEQFTGWSAQSQDPVTGQFIGVVPEPTSMALFGMGVVTLMGSGLRRRRKEQAATADV